MNEGGVDHGGLLGKVQQVVQIAEMSMAAADSVASTVLIENEHLSGTEPALHMANRDIRVTIRQQR